MLREVSSTQKKIKLIFIAITFPSFLEYTVQSINISTETFPWNKHSSLELHL